MNGYIQVFNVIRMGEEKAKIEQNKHYFPSQQSIYKMEADFFPVYEGSENKLDLP